MIEKELVSFSVAAQVARTVIVAPGAIVQASIAPFNDTFLPRLAWHEDLLTQGDWEERGPDLMWVRASISAIGAIAAVAAEGRQNVPHRQIAIYENAISSVSGLPGLLTGSNPFQKDEPARYIGVRFTDRTTSNVLLQESAFRTLTCNAAPRAVEEGIRDAIEFLNDGSNWRVVARIAKALAGGAQLASGFQITALVMAGLNDSTPWRGTPDAVPAALATK